MRARSAWAGLGLFLFGLLLAEVGVRFLGWDSRFFPAPSTILARLTLMLQEPSFREHVLASGIRWSLGLCIAMLLSVALVVLASLWSGARSFLNALVGLLTPLPKSAVFPMFLLLFGIEGAGHVALITMGASSLILATLLAGLVRLEAVGYLPLARALSLNRWRTLVRVILPGLVPDFIQGLKLGSNYALVLVVVSEMMMTRKGLGVVLWASWDNFRIVDLYAVLYLICLIGMATFVVFEHLNEWAMDYQKGV